MTTNILVFLFVGLFILFLIESIYFLKKKLNVGIVESPTNETNQRSGKMILIGGLIIAALAFLSFGWLFLTKQKSSTLLPETDQSLRHQVSPTNIPNQPPTPTVAEIAYTYPTVTSAPILLFTPTTGIRIIPTKTPIPTRTPTPTKPPSPTPTKKITATPTPSKTPPIGGPASPSQGGPEITLAISPTPTEAVVIVPKMPTAGSILPTFALLLFAVSFVMVGLIL